MEGFTLPAAAVSPPSPTIPGGERVEAHRLRTTAQEFEGVFLGMLMKAMRSTVAKGGLFGSGTDSQMYREMFDEEIGRAMARGGGIGLVELILRDQARREAQRSEKKTQGPTPDTR